MFAATTVFPNAVVAASTPVSYVEKGCGRLTLFSRQLAEKACLKGPSLLAFVTQLGLDAYVA